MNANKCIACTVQQCANHAASGDYCGLEHILVGTHEEDPTKIPCTDCKSFRRK